MSTVKPPGASPMSADFIAYCCYPRPRFELSLLRFGLAILGICALLVPVTGTAAQSQSVLGLSEILYDIAGKSPDVLAALAEQRKAKARVGQARASWFGTADVYGLSQHYNDPRLLRPITSPPNIANYPFASDQLSYGIEFNLPLDVSLRIAAEVDAARASAHAARWNADDARLRVLLNGATLYRDLQALNGRRMALNRQSDALVASVRVANAGVRAGTFSKLKRLRLEAALAEVRAVRAGVEGAIRKLRAQLAALMGKSRLGGAIAQLTSPPTQLPASGGFLSTPRVQAARSALRASQGKLSAARRSLLPQFFINGRWNENAIQQGYAHRIHTWQVGLGVKLNLWSGGGQVSAIDAASASETVARERLREARFALRAAREAASAQWQAGQQAYAAAQTGLDAALQSARIERGNFRAGLGSATDLLDAEAALAQARSALTSSLASWWQADATLRYAYGETPLTMKSGVSPQGPIRGVQSQ